MNTFNTKTDWVYKAVKELCPEIDERIEENRKLDQFIYQQEEKYIQFIINSIGDEPQEIKEEANKSQQDAAEEGKEKVLNNKITLNINRRYFTTKPQKKDIKVIQSEIGSQKETLTVQELIDEIAKGSTIKAGALNGNKNIDWESQQVFCIDIDNDEKSVEKYGMLIPIQAYGRCCGLGIRPTFYYESFSSKPEHPKFRLVFVTDEAVTDIRIRNSIQMALMTIFPESDKACKDLSRIFFGSPDKVTVFNNAQDRLNPYILVQGMVARIKRMESASNATKIIGNYCETVGLNMINGLPDVRIITDEYSYIPPVIDDYEEASKMEKVPAPLYIYYRGEGEISKIQYNFNIELENSYKITVASEGKKLPKTPIVKEKYSYKDELIQRFDFDSLTVNCELWNDFINGSRWCYHNEIFGIASNMWRAEGAETKIINAIEANDNYKDKYNKINTVKCCRSYGYAPQRCCDFCPYYKQCPNNQVNMLTAVNNKRGGIRKIEDIEFKDKEDIRSEMATEFFTILNNLEDTNINVIKAPTGIGKTEMLKGIKNYTGMCIAVPTHKLAKEVYERLNIPKAILATDIELSDKGIESEYKRLQAIGNYKDAHKLLEAYRTDLNAIKDNRTTAVINETLDITRYLDMQKEIHVTNKPIICTHQKLLNLNNPNIHTYIIDEDILLSSLFQTVPLSIDEIDKLTAKAKLIDAKTLVSAFATLKNYVEDSRNNCASVTTVPALHYSEKEVKEFIKEYSLSLDVNIQNLLAVKKIKTDIIGTTLGAIKHELPNGRIIILSATVNEVVYKGFFVDREVNYIDLGTAKPEGKIIQHYYGFSRSFLAKNATKALDIIKAEAPEINNLITFKKYESNFTKAGLTPITNFGATTGIDAYGGQDLIIAGTPHIIDSVYKLLASFIAPDAQIISDCEYQNVKRNGYEFYFNTYNSNINTPSANIVQEIQFYMIEAELIQAVGRARALNNNCTVHVFSNYPLVESVLYTK